MLKRDFIMIQIEEIGKAIALLFFNRNKGKGQDKIQPSCPKLTLP